MFYNQKEEVLINEFKTDLKGGLGTTDAQKRLDKDGLNVLPTRKRNKWWNFLLRQLRSPLVYILLIGALLTFILKEWVDMTVILLAVFVNISVGFWQEFRSSNILETLRAIVEVKALVIRDGALHEINAEGLVRGDIVVLRAGNKVPADARILSSENLKVNESLLTGESSPVSKHEGVLSHGERGVGDRTNMVHMGTVITRGEARALIVATGTETEIGKIALLTQTAEDEPTPLQIRIGKLGKVLAIIIGIASVFIFVIGIVEDHTFREMFTTAIAVAVAAIPEGLPAAISIVLAVSAQKILKRKGIVKQLVAAETLGSASIICADKTGTLTEGKMKIKELVSLGDKARASEILALANEALLEKTDEGIVARGDTTDKAKMQFFLDEGGDFDELIGRLPRINLLQFDPIRKYIASLHKTDNGRETLFLSGAPEALIQKSGYVATKTGKTALLGEHKRALDEAYKKLAREGYRVIALALRHMDVNSQGKVNLEDEAKRREYVRDLTFYGLVAIRDPIREDVKESIQTARRAGVRPIMLTGDHALTAGAIGAELGFKAIPEQIVEGSRITHMSDMELEKHLQNVDIFARVNPEHKMRIIDVLQNRGEVVAMTGDGVNDAPALKAADIGVALDSGTDVSKEAADLILLNNSFTVIVSAIRQGRIAFDNIRKVTVFLLVQSFTELILILSALLFRIPLPFTAVQILWTNLIEDSFPNVALSFEPGEKDVMERKPLKKNEPILDTKSKTIVFVVGLLTDFLLLGLFMWLYFTSDLPLDHIRTFIFAALGFDSFFYIYSIKSLTKPIFSYDLLDNPLLVGATILGIGLMLAAIYMPLLNSFLGTTPLALSDWIVVISLGLIKITGVEITKWWFVRR